MTRYGMVIDVGKCTACYGCFTACKDEFWDNDYQYSAGQPRFGQFWMNLTKNERGRYPYVKVAYMPTLCQHCQDAPCSKVAENGAVHRTAQGAVIIDPQKAVGQKKIAEACPYKVVFWNEEKQLPQKCSLCAHRLEEGKVPRCVQICPSGCLSFGDFDDPNSAVSQLLKSAGAEVFHAEWKTNPNIYYLNLQRMTKNLIAGAVVLGDVNDCADGALVKLQDAKGNALETKSNFFGNFEFDGLDDGDYTLVASHEGYGTQTIPVSAKGSTYVGDIILGK